jgi:hypothetical protein
LTNLKGKNATTDILVNNILELREETIPYLNKKNDSKMKDQIKLCEQKIKKLISSSVNPLKK